MIIDSKPWTLGTLFEGKYFRIPRYQRPYSWERSHLEDFWQDAVQAQSEADYFIGSVVASKARRDAVYAVVDGQQRLTTATVLLCVLRDTFEREGFQDLADGVHTLIERKNIRNACQYVLATQSSYPFLQENIQKRGRPELTGSAGPEEEALKIAHDFFKVKIAEVVNSVKNDSSLSVESQPKELVRKLEDVRDHILSLQVIFIEIEDEDDAYLVFETLNTRGKDLRVSDLVKNLILRHKQPTNEGVDVGKDKWEAILETLEESEAGMRVDAFLHHSWLSRHAFVAQKSLYKAVKTEITRPQAGAFLETLVVDSKIYRVIHEPEFRKKKWIQQEEAIRRSLSALSLFGVRLSVPLILALMRDWENGAIKLPVVRDTLSSLESFHFISNAVTEQRVTGGLAMMFASLACQVHQAPPNGKPAVCAEIRKKLRERVPDIELFRVAFRKIVHTKAQTKHKNLVKYALERFADHWGWAINGPELSIEHLRSQSSSDVPESVIGQVGNLLLVPPKVNNELLRNKNPNEKREILKNKRIPIPPRMEVSEKWGKNEIEAHTDCLAELAHSAVWRV